MTDIPLVALSGVQLTQTPVMVDDVTGLITSPTLLPVNQNHLATKEYVDQTAAGYVTDQDLQDLTDTLVPSADLDGIQAEIDLKADQTSLDALSADVLHLDGGIMTGPITWSGTPATGATLVNRTYVENMIGSQLAEALTITAGDTRYVNIDGDTVTGPIILPADPVTGLEAATKQYVDARQVNTSFYLALSGGAMEGPLILASDPTQTMEAVTKQYVDNIADLRLNPKLAAFYSGGAIPLHYSRHTIEWDAADPTLIRGWRNRGSLGSAYDAMIPDVRPAFPAKEGMLGRVPTSTTVYTPVMATELRFGTNARLLMVMEWVSIGGTPNWHGGNEGAAQNNVRMQGSGSSRILISDAEGTSTNNKALTGYYDYWTGRHILEIEFDYTGRMLRCYVNGVSQGSNTMADTDTGFTLAYLWSNTGTVTQMDAWVGDTVLIDMTDPDAAAALDYMRQYLCDTYGITNGVLPVPAAAPSP